MYKYLNEIVEVMNEMLSDLRKKYSIVLCLTESLIFNIYI